MGEPVETSEMPDAEDAINGWGRVTDELGLPWNATASRVLECIRALAAERDRLREACSAMDKALSGLWTGGPQREGHSLYLGAPDDAWHQIRAALDDAALPQPPAKESGDD